MSVNYDYLAELQLDPQTKLYNLFISTYNGNTTIVGFYRVTRAEEMRMDKVSRKLYNTSEYVGTLCQLNDILNPYAIREGDMLAYCTQDQAINMMKVANIIKQSGIDELIAASRRDLLNSYKKTQQDPARRNYLDKRDNAAQLPPSVMPSNVPQIVLENNKIKVSGGTFSATGSSNGADLFMGAGWDHDPLGGNAAGAFVLANDAGLSGLYAGSGTGIGSASLTGNGTGIGGSGFGQFGDFNTGSAGNGSGDAGGNGSGGSGDGSGANGGIAGNTPILGTGQSSDYERILIRRYIKKIS